MVRTLVVRYPDGTRTRLVDVAANRIVAPPEPSSLAAELEPSRREVSATVRTMTA